MKVGKREKKKFITKNSALRNSSVSGFIGHISLCNRNKLHLH